MAAAIFCLLDAHSCRRWQRRRSRRAHITEQEEQAARSNEGNAVRAADGFHLFNAPAEQIRYPTINF
jgi:hypothetical protein